MCCLGAVSGRYANLFPDLALALRAEALFKQRRRKGSLPAANYAQARPVQSS